MPTQEMQLCLILDMRNAHEPRNANRETKASLLARAVNDNYQSAANTIKAVITKIGTTNENINCNNGAS